MASERSPLLNHDVEQIRSIPRPDLRYSPENVVVDGNENQNLDGKKIEIMNFISTSNFV